MSKRIWQGITSTTLLTLLGATVFLGEFSPKTIASNANHNSSVSSPDETATQQTKRVLSNPSARNLSRQNQEPIVTLFSHPWKSEGKIAVTLRIQNIPVLTFLGEADQTPDSPSHPLTRAEAVANRLNQRHEQNFDAQTITVSFNSKDSSYGIKIDEEELVIIDQNTILPDTTNKPDQDALQATNRLRRLLGNAAPLTEIAGLPQPKQATKQSGRKGRGGVASWYGPGFHGRRTANGERFNQNALTAAHKSLPFGTRVRVTNLRNGRSVTVRINDRGPYSGGRVIDLSAQAAKVIGLYHSGTAPVSLDILGR